MTLGPSGPSRGTHNDFRCPGELIPKAFASQTRSHELQRLQTSIRYLVIRSFSSQALGH